MSKSSTFKLVKYDKNSMLKNINCPNNCIELVKNNLTTVTWLAWKDCGIKTLVMLDDQGEQLEKFEKGVDGINNDMRLAEEALRSMDLLCGIFPKFWKKSGGFKEDDAVWGEQKVRQSLPQT